MENTGNFKIRFYKDSDWPGVRDFITLNWRQDHPMCRRPLFDWQFKGFGNENGKVHSLVLVHNDKIVGFRGVIPGIYQVPSGKNRMDILQGGSLAMWMIQKELQGKGLGLQMHLEAQNMMAVITGAGSNPKTSLGIYLKNGFSVLESMNRYVAPLDAPGYQMLLSQKVDIKDIMDWVNSQAGPRGVIEPGEPDVDTIAAVWEKAAFLLRIFSLYRNAEFWKWRYVDSPGFQYLFFGDPKKTGLVVARTEVICSDELKELNGKKVFRIIEILPKDSRAWKGEIDTALIGLIHGVIRWAVKEGCLAADFYCSTSRFDPILKTVGFRKHDINSSSSICSLALLFQPLKYIALPINALFRIDMAGKGLIKLDFQDTYMVKSENDMDRPNIYNYENLI